MSLPRRFRRNVSTGYLKTGSTALITLVMTPVLITGLGTEAFGIWIVVGSLALYREILQFGFSTATPKYVAEYAALDDQERLRSSIATAFWMLAIPGAVALVLGLGLAAVFPQLFHVSSGLQGQTQVLVLIIAIDFALAIPTDAFGGVLVGLQRYDLLNTTLITVNVAQAIAWAVVIVAGGGLVPLGASTVAISLLGQLWRYRVARRLVPGLSISPRSVDRKLVRPFTGLSVWYAVQNVATLVLNRIDTIVVGIVLGVAAAGVYAVGQKFTLAIGQLLTPVSTVFFPHSSELSAQRDTAGLRRSLLTGTRILLAVAAPFALTLAILAGPLIQAWVGSGFDGAVPVVIFLAGAVSIWAVSETGLVMLEGDGRIRVPALIRASEAVLNFGLSLTLAHLIGLKGVALGTLLAAAAANLLVFIPHMCRQFGLELRVFAGSLIAAHAPPAATALAVGWLVTRADPSTVPALAAAAAGDRRRVSGGVCDHRLRPARAPHADRAAAWSPVSSLRFPGMKRPDQQVLHARGDLRPGEVRRAGGPGAPQGLGSWPVEQQLAHGVGDRTRIRGIDEQTRLPVDDGVEGSGDVARHHGERVRARLEVDDPEALPAPPARRKPAGHREDVCTVEPGVTLIVRQRALEDGAVRNPLVACELGELVAQRPVAHDHPGNVGNRGLDSRQGLNQHVVALVAGRQPRQRQHGGTRVPLRRSRGRKVHAGRDAVHSRLVGADVGREPARVAADRDARRGAFDRESRQAGPRRDLVPVQVLNEGSSGDSLDERRRRGDDDVRA